VTPLSTCPWNDRARASMVEKGVAMKCFSRGTRGEAGVLSGEAEFAGFEVEEGRR
jgi:hypothetical protein